MASSSSSTHTASRSRFIKLLDSDFLMSVVQRFVVSKTGDTIQMQASSHSMQATLHIGNSRSVLRLVVIPSGSAQLLIEKVTIDDSVNLIEYPLKVPLTGPTAAACLPENAQFCAKHQVPKGTHFKSFETYLVILEGAKCDYPVRGWIHYKLLN